MSNIIITSKKQTAKEPHTIHIFYIIIIIIIQNVISPCLHHHHVTVICSDSSVAMPQAQSSTEQFLLPLVLELSRDEASSPVGGLSKLQPSPIRRICELPEVFRNDSAYEVERKELGQRPLGEPLNTHAQRRRSVLKSPQKLSLMKQ